MVVGQHALNEHESSIHHRGTENTEVAQRKDKPLCNLCVLCASVVNLMLLRLSSLNGHTTMIKSRGDYNWKV
ncbi:MAG: hypothetical protein QOD00_2 [Blastocatellia bacterium]|jgi:hypothetical protein|nr:hypothetical protein [Blastocatellia bacterium]